MDLKPKKSLGQNFLKSKEALSDIVEASDPQNTDIILEIGPGKGILTERLLMFAAKVIAIEADIRMVEFLKEKFSQEIVSGKLDIIHQDVLEFDPELFNYKEYKIVANIPYYITGALIKKFLTCNNQPKLMVLLLQKEVAKRIVAQDKKESLLSISVKVYGRPKYISTVKAKYFSPQPKVDSGILLIEHISKAFFASTYNSTSNISLQEQEFFKIVKTGFAHKRKMLYGNLKELYDTEKLERAFVEAHIDGKARAEDINLEQWEKLYMKLQ